MKGAEYNQDQLFNFVKNQHPKLDVSKSSDGRAVYATMTDLLGGYFTVTYYVSGIKTIEGTAVRRERSTFSI